MGQNCTKAIIVAAGMGSRLQPLTNGKPKCLLDVNGMSILERTTTTLKKCNIDDIVVVKGYHKEMINFPDLRYYENTDYTNNNILESLFYASSEMEEDFIFSYSDILYSKQVVRKLLKAKTNFAIVVDTDWRKHYEGRTLHPITEAELVAVKDGRVTKIGKDNVLPDEAYGEFIGLARFTKVGAEIMALNYFDALVKYDNMQFHQAKNIHKAYLTDMIQELIDNKYSVRSVDISGDWQEIDTIQDLERAKLRWH